MNRALLVSRVEKLVHAHGYSYVSLGDVDLAENLAAKGVSTSAFSSRDEAHEGVFLAACWAFENIKHGDQLHRIHRIYHYGDYAGLGSVPKDGSAPRILQFGIEQFNGTTPRDDAALMVLAFKILASLGFSDRMFRIGNVEILAQMLTPYPYIVKNEVLRDLEELSELDDQIQHLIRQHVSMSGNDTKTSSVEEDIHGLCKRLVDKTEQEFGGKPEWNERHPVADVKQLFEAIKQLHLREKWNATCGVSEAIGKSLLDLLSLKGVSFEEALRRPLGQELFRRHTAALDLLKQTSEHLRALMPNGVPTSGIALDPCLSHGLGHYTC